MSARSFRNLYANLFQTRNKVKYDFVINMIELANTENKIMRVFLLDCPKIAVIPRSSLLISFLFYLS